jgi:hypothetical protein
MLLRDDLLVPVSQAVPCAPVVSVVGGIELIRILPS